MAECTTRNAAGMVVYKRMYKSRARALSALHKSAKKNVFTGWFAPYKCHKSNCHSWHFGNVGPFSEDSIHFVDGEKVKYTKAEWEKGRAFIYG